MVSPSLSNVRKVTCGSDHTCALTDFGELYCWGRNDQGQLGRGHQLSPSSDPQIVSTLSSLGAVDVIAAGYSSTCATVASSSRTYCWGQNLHGELGIGTLNEVKTLPTPMLIDYAGGGPVHYLAAGQYAFCGISYKGGLHCVGRNTNGQLGDGTTIDRSTIVPVVGMGSGTRHVALSSSRTCAIQDSGEAFCWGYFVGDYACCIGNGSLSVQNSQPVRVFGEPNHKEIVTGSRITCSIRGENNEVWCWGNGEYSGLGNGTNGSGFIATVPQPVLYGEYV